MLKRIILFLVLTTALLSTTAVSYAASGTGPTDAVSPNRGTQTVQANSAQWFGFELGGKKEDVSVTLDAASAEGLRLEIYTPEQAAAYQNGESVKAIGAATAQKTHTLAWYGTFNQ